MILPIGMVKALDIDPQTMLLLLKVKGIDDIYIKIMRQDKLAEKNTENTISAADKVMQTSQQSSSSSGAVPEIVRRGDREDGDLVRHVINESEN